MCFNHLREQQFGYLYHLYRSWRWAAMLFVHGLIPDAFKTTVSDEICKGTNPNHPPHGPRDKTKTRRYLLEKHYGIKDE